jgi:glutamyl-tRNA reductase
MTVLFVGASHATVPMSLIERLRFNDDDAVAILSSITSGDRRPTLPVGELVVLSTCHRVELYAVAAHDEPRPSVALDALVHVLASRAPEHPGLDAQVRRLTGTEATRHLFRVAAGLESMVLGESELLGQVSAALALATRIGSAGAVLTPLFEAAVRTGRRARAETAIATEPASVSTIAAELAEELAEDLRGRRALFVGAGEVPMLTARALRERGYWEMSIAAPASGDAQELDASVGLPIVPVDAIPAEISESDLVITYAGAPMPIDASLVRGAMRGRMARPLAVIDLSAGETLEAGVSDLPGVRVIGPSELRERIDRTTAERRREVPLVETIIEQEVRALEARSDAIALSGVVAALRTRAEEIRQRELGRALANLPNADAAVRAQMEWLSVSLVNKILDEPTRRLRAEATQGQANPYADMTRELFGLAAERADQPPA